MFGHFIGRSRIRRWKDLNPGATPLPRTGYAKAAETVVAPDLQRDIKQGLVNLLSYSALFSGVMRLDLSDEEATALIRELHDIIENDRYFNRRLTRKKSQAMLSL
jgi:hypothetical protein